MSKAQKTYVENKNSISYWKAAIIIAPLLLLVVASLFFNYVYPGKHVIAEHLFTAGNSNKDETTSETKPKFVDLGTFAVHLKGDSEYLRASITVKLTKPGLDEKIKANIPEITHHVNMVLQNKQSSELSTYEGKEKLAQQIKEQVEHVMGFMQMDSASSILRNGISEVLFTSFIIQY